MNLSRRAILAGMGSTALVSHAQARFPRGLASSVSSATQSFKTLKIGGGGFMTGLDLQADGTKLCKCDQNGAWIWNSGTGVWDSLLTPTRGFAPAVPGQYAAYDLAAAPSNTNVIYLLLGNRGGSTTDLGGTLWRSLDKGASFVQLTGFAATPLPCNNGGVRFNGRRIAIDPINPDVVYIGCPGDGGATAPVLRVTSNGAQGSASTPTFSTVASVTAPTGFTQGAPSGHNIAFDPNGGSTAGKSNVVAVFSGGVGLFTTSAPLGSFTQATTTGAPTSCSRMAYSTVNTTGKNILYVANDTTTLYKFASSAWTSLTPGISVHSISVDPADNTRLLAASDGGTPAISTNSGAGWTTLGYLNGGLNNSPDIPWLALTQDSYKTSGDMLFDPGATNTVLFSQGIGIFVKTSFPNSGSFAWTSQTKGIENMTTNAVVASPTTTSTPTIAKWDRFGFYSANQDAYPSTQLPNNLYSIQVCWDMDWASSDQKTIVGYARNNTIFNDASGLSSDNGQTWTFFPMITSLPLTTSAGATAGTNTLTFSSFPSFTPQLQMLVTNSTHPTAIPAGTYITAVNGSVVTLSQNIASPGVSSGDTINFGFGGPSQFLITSGSASTGATSLTFTTAVPANIKVGMLVNNVDNKQPTNLGGGSMSVTAISGSTITLSAATLGTIPSGSLIQFAWPDGGCVAASSPTNFMIVSFYYPLVTADGGTTWTPIDISGVTRPVKGVFTSGSNNVTGSDTTNLVVGGGITTNNIPAYLGYTVQSITNSTTFVMSGNAPATATETVYQTTGWGNANYLNHKVCAADRVTANKFYLYNYLTGKVYVSTSSGANGTWTVANTGIGSTNLITLANMQGGQGMAMKSVPSNAGHLFASNANVPSGGNNVFIRSINGGVDWTVVSGVTGVQVFGFGCPKPGGGGYPTVFVYGTVGTTKSFWRSDDNCATWIDLDPRASGVTGINMGFYAGGTSIDMLSNLDGDKNVYGRVYFGFSAAGCGYYG